MNFIITRLLWIVLVFALLLGSQSNWIKTAKQKASSIKLFATNTAFRIFSSNSSQSIIKEKFSIKKYRSSEVAIAYNASSFLLPQGLHRKTLPTRLTAITYVNGIYHSEEDWARITSQLAQLFGQEIKPFYNPSSGWWVTDATKAGLNLVSKSNQNTLARLLAKHLRVELSELAPNGRILHLAHSAGAILTYLAAKHYLSKSEVSRIDVVTFGGGRSITKKYFPGHLVNYYAQNDPCLFVDSKASKLIKYAKFEQDSLICVNDGKYNTSYIFLEAMTNNPIHDHSMEGPTYRIALLREAQQFQRRLRNMSKEQIKQLSQIRRLRKLAANITGMHRFWTKTSLQTKIQLRKIRNGISNIPWFVSIPWTIKPDTLS